MSIITIEQLKSKFEGGDFPGSADYINLIDTLAALPEAGAGGNTVLSGSGAPSNGTGSNGDFYINAVNYDIYGPKTSGTWGSPTSLVGPTGATGSAGATGAAGTNGTNGTNGATGDTGPAGPGVSSGGTTGQYLTKVDGTNYNTQWSTLDLSGKQDVVANVSSTEIGYLDGVTSSIQTQIDTKAPLASPTFTGTVSGVTKTHVGLANVDNTTDALKPVSTATQTALDLKANSAGPTFTGTVTLPSSTAIGNVTSTEIEYVDGVTSAIQTQLDAKTAKSTLTTTGDIYYASAANTPARLGIGSTSNVLTVAGGVPSWAAPASGGFTTAIFHDAKADQSAGGTFTSGAWRTRDLNTSQFNNITSCSLASNQITLPAGSYQIWGFAPAFDVNRHQARFQNITDTSTTILGMSSYTRAGANAQTGYASIQGAFTIAGTKTFEFQHRAETTKASNGFGVSADLGSGEIYAQITISKVA